MMSVNILDELALISIVVICIISMIGFIEIGFLFGQFRQAKQNKAQMAQVRAIMGASLGLLAFMLAFSFSMAQQHFETRMQTYLLEINAIDSTYRSADLLSKNKDQDKAKHLLQKFVQLRFDTSKAADSGDMEGAFAMIRESEQIHDQLWEIVVAETSDPAVERDTGLFSQSVLAMMDANDARLQAVLFNRISPVIWLMQFLMALLSMIIMGYQAGLTGTRSRLATWTLAVTFSAVMALVTDLDRPNMTLFHLDQSLMLDLQKRMAGDLLIHLPGSRE